MLSQLTLYYATKTTITEHGIRDTMKFNFCAQQFVELPFPFPNFEKNFKNKLFDSWFKIFEIRSHMEGEGKCRVLIMEITALVKTALKIYYSMLSPLA